MKNEFNHWSVSSPCARKGETEKVTKKADKKLIFFLKSGMLIDTGEDFFPSLTTISMNKSAWEEWFRSWHSMIEAREQRKGIKSICIHSACCLISLLFFFFFSGLSFGAEDVKYLKPQTHSFPFWYVNA